SSDLPKLTTKGIPVSSDLRLRGKVNGSNPSWLFELFELFELFDFKFDLKEYKEVKKRFIIVDYILNLIIFNLSFRFVWTISFRFY
ncbi:hypothetical protein, partial [Campylobacter lanienae]|uniref:hypothetical protein n=1 Tax=Campylobacter lanienae TaxID=75658 RepID=UPI001F2E1146